MKNLLLTLLILLSLCLYSCVDEGEDFRLGNPEDTSTHQPDGGNDITNNGGGSVNNNVITPIDVLEYVSEENVLPGFADPDRALGLPKGGGLDGGSTDVVSLGHDGDDAGDEGGHIILEFGKKIINGPGVDFKVFENPFNVSGMDSIFIEAAKVYLSEDGVNWEEFPNSIDPAFSNDDPEHYTGFAGVNPVIANRDDPDSPNPEDADSGGDFFDLEDMPDGSSVKENGFRFIKIVDAGVEINDRGNGDPPATNSGFDLDAVVGINYE